MQFTIWLAGNIVMISYDKLWKPVVQNKMKKGQLAQAVDIRFYTMTRLNHDKSAQMEVVLRICKVFHSDIGDIMKVTDDG